MGTGKNVYGPHNKTLMYETKKLHCNLVRIIIRNIHYLIKSIWTSLCSSKLSLDVTTTTLTGIKGGRKLCCSLLSSTSSIGRSGELSDFERGLVIGCYISKKSVRGIAILLNLPKLTAATKHFSCEC
jgi:hypothetical protein